MKTDLAAVVTGDTSRGRTQFKNELPLLPQMNIPFFLYLQIDFNTAQNGPTIRILSRANSFNVSVLRVEHAQVGGCFRNAAEVNS